MKKTFTLMIAFLLLLGYKVQSQEVDKLFSLSGITSSDEVETTKFTYNENQLLESSHYLLFDASGKNVYTLQNINRNNCSLDINSLDKGMYIINITTSRGIIADKVIVK